MSPNHEQSWPSAHYLRALEEAKQHHASSKTYSGKFLRPHAPHIKELIERLECRSVLDYGCGKGRQYEWRADLEGQAVPKGMTIEEFWGVPVTKYDPAWPPFAKRPAGRFDLVICTHTIGSIPVVDLGWVTLEIQRYAVQAVYYAEKLGPVGKKVFSQPDVMPHGWTRDQWAAALKPRGRPMLEVWLATRENRGAEGVIVTREQLR